MFNYITKEDKMESLFFQLPKALIYEQKYKSLSANAKILYSFLLERTNISLTNEWIDKEGRVYIICELSEIELILNCSRGTANKSLKELSDINLVMKFRNGQGKANFLYVAKVDTTKDTLDTHIKFHKKELEFKKSKNYTSVENTSVEKKENNKKVIKTSDSNRSTKNRLLEVQNLDRKETKYKDIEDDDYIPEVSEKKKRVLSLFDISNRQYKLLNDLDDDVIDKAINITLANDGNTFQYFYKVYCTVKNSKKISDADLRKPTPQSTTKITTLSSNNSIISNKKSYSNKPNKNGFRNFTETIFDYSEDDLMNMINQSQKRKYAK